MRTKTLAVLLLIAGLSACSKTTPAPTASTGQAATVMMKDGTTFAGTVTSSDTSAITVQSASGESRTIPMTQVSGVQYGPAAPAPLTSNPASPAPPVNQPAMAPPPPVTTPAPAQTTTTAVPPPIQPSRRVEPVRPVEPVAEFRVIPSGTMIEVRNNETINSETAETGQTYSAVVARDISDSEGRIAIPRGSNATLIVRGANGQGKMQGRSELVLDIASVAVQGRTYRLETQDLVQRGTAGVGKNKRTGEFLGGGAALGGIIGAIAGGGKGAAIGALSGAGAGAATQTITRGKAVRVPSETLLDFRLEAPIRIRELR